jgi:SPASM domain peptide maturase of grasp-with-spasm system
MHQRQASKYLKVQAECLPVKGHRRSTVCDLPREEYKLIPNDMYDFLMEYENKLVSEIAKDCDPEDLDSYLSYLEQHEYIFYCEDWERALFTKIDMTYKYPGHISNLVLDIAENSDYEPARAIEIASKLGPVNVQVRGFDDVSLEYLQKLMAAINGVRIRSLEFIVKYSELLKVDDIEKLCEEYKQILSFVFHTAPYSKVESVTIAQKLRRQIGFIEQPILDHTACGNISPHYFNSNITFYSESQSHNTCLNQKLSIDVDGNIKNCPSMPESFGNINEVTEDELGEIVKGKGFQKYWNIKKDDIKICRDCEFRHICTDCRAYREDESDMNSKPLKCGYNPYIAKWNTEEGHETVAESIKRSIVSEEYVYRPVGE